MDYLHIYNEVIAQLTGRKPKTNDLYDNIYKIGGLIDQLGELKKLAYWLKNHAKLTYKTEKKAGIEYVKMKDGKVTKKAGLVNYYTKVKINITKDLTKEEKDSLERKLKQPYLEDLEG